ncbi:YadA-like family protein [Fusobacterium watanabei]|uniref:YadA-like family protein n=1 Tax=Fusobacterium watanabei TaxID=2686067 RepID=UPI003B58715E
MKKSLSLKLIVFSLFLVVASISYSAPVFQGGTGTDSTEAGVNNTASEQYSSAFGYLNTASGRYSSAFGFENKASEQYSSAFGYLNTASGRYSSAFGNCNKASGENSSAFGYFNTAREENTSAIGYRNTASGQYSSAFGYENKASGQYSSAFGYENKASGKDSSAFGYQNTASGLSSSAFGYENKASGKDSSAFGNWNMVGKLKDDGSGNLIPDENFGKNSLAFGTEYQVTGNSSGAFGVGLLSGGGYQYVNEGNDSYMIGNKNKIASGSDDNFILGNNVEIGAGVQKSVVLGDGSASGGSNTVSVGSSALQRKIVNVGEGEISATSTDAITGKQLYSGEGIDTAAWKAKLGVGAGGVDLSAYAKRDASNLIPSDISAWQTKLDITKKADYKDANDIDVNKWKAKLGVGSGGGGGAIDAYTKDEADNKFANKTDLNDYTKKDDYIDANGIDVDKWKAKLGTGASSTDIQNLRNEVYEKIDDVKDEVRDVGSLSAALAGLHPMQYDPKAPAQVMAALGHYKDRQAVAVGASYYFNDRFMMSTGIALSGEKKTKTMANVGFTLKLGKGSGVTYNETPQYVVQNEVKRLTVENQELKTEINSLNTRNKEQDEKIKNLEEKLNMLLKNK